MATIADNGEDQGARPKWRKPVRYIEIDTGYLTSCWIWQLATNQGRGYGLVRVNGHLVLAHRAYYEERFGPIPRDRELDHLCSQRACVRPEHLEPVTHAENCQRGGRAKLTPAQVAEIRSSSDSSLVLARRFGISRSHVSRIRHNKAWRATSPQSRGGVAAMQLPHGQMCRPGSLETHQALHALWRLSETGGLVGTVGLVSTAPENGSKASSFRGEQCSTSTRLPGQGGRRD